MANIEYLPHAQNSRGLRALSFWHAVTVRGMRDMPYDLSTRQVSILLSVYLTPPPHSVKSLADDLRISKPAVCRALDVLERLKFVKRSRDKGDKRNVFVQRTVKGSVYLSDFADIIVAVSQRAS